MKPAIDIRNLGKQYELNESAPYLALRDILSQSVKKVFSPSAKKEKFWALRNIDLRIEPGERVGIIGRNGAGKSTLLKIISRITPPTTGEAFIRGRVGSLLEVGTGFHPELTGRENIYLNGSILGLKKAEITRQLDAIINFSGVEKFIDTPLKHYSSGMQLRLAFSVAAHLEPEILLIDEVLAVGDLEFQKKCLGKMEEVSKIHGRTILFVSHDLGAVSTLTNKSILLDKGQLLDAGPTAAVINNYTALFLNSTKFETAADTNKPCITSVSICTSEGGTLHKHGSPLQIHFRLHNPLENYQHLAMSFQIINNRDNPVIYKWLFDKEQPFGRAKGNHDIQFDFPELKLYKGNYHLRIHLADSKTREKFQQTDCCHFQVEMINLPEPEWGWNDGVCQYMETGEWKIGNNE